MRDVSHVLCLSLWDMGRGLAPVQGLEAGELREDVRVAKAWATTGRNKMILDAIAFIFGLFLFFGALALVADYLERKYGS